MSFTPSDSSELLEPLEPYTVPTDMLGAVRRTLRGLSLNTEERRRYAAATRLVLTYAQAIDDRTLDGDPKALTDLGPKLLAALVALGAVPANEKNGGSQPNHSPVSDELEQLRAKYRKIRKETT